MAKYAVTLSNEGGPLDTKIVEQESGIADTAIRLIQQTGSLQAGDTITVTEVEE